MHFLEVRINNFRQDNISNTGGEFIVAKKIPNAGTNASKVRAQNNAAANNQEVEFASQTNAAEVREQNRKSQANKS